MFDPELTNDDVMQVLAAMTADDPAMGRFAADAWMMLTAGEGPAMVSLAGLQNWIWWLLPKRSLGDDYDFWVDTAAAAAVLFDRLGSASYAQVCRSDTTAKVLAAWRASPSKGNAASRKALAASAVEPPDLDDFAWGTIFGPWENDAHDAVEAALRQKISHGIVTKQF